MKMCKSDLFVVPEPSVRENCIARDLVAVKGVQLEGLDVEQPHVGKAESCRIDK